MTYEAVTRMQRNEFITDPRVPDPANLPIPLGWCLLVRPYPITKKNKSSLIISSDITDSMSYTCNIARVVAIGDCCWSRPEHHTFEGEKKRWVEVGDFISFPRNTGGKRKFKDVSFVLLTDDEVVERLPDPLAYDDGFFEIDVPKEDLEKYNTIYNLKGKE